MIWHNRCNTINRINCWKKSNFVKAPLILPDFPKYHCNFQSTMRRMHLFCKKKKYTCTHLSKICSKHVLLDWMSTTLCKAEFLCSLEGRLILGCNILRVFKVPLGIPSLFSLLIFWSLGKGNFRAVPVVKWLARRAFNPAVRVWFEDGPRVWR